MSRSNFTAQPILSHITALSLIVLTVLLGQILIQNILNEQEKNLNRMNIASQQKILHKKILSSMAQIQVSKSIAAKKKEGEALKKTLNEFEVLSRALQMIQAESLEDGSLKRISASALIAPSDYREFIKLARGLCLTLKAERLPGQNSLIAEYIQKSIQEEKKFSQKIDRLIFQYQIKENLLLAQLKEAEKRLNICTFAILLIEFLFIFLPLNKQFKELFKELSENTNALQKEKIKRQNLLELLQQHSVGSLQNIIDSSESLPDIKISQEKDFASITKKSAASVLALIEHFTKKENQNIINFDLRELAEDLIDIFAYQIRDRKIELFLDYEFECPRFVRGNANYLRLVLMNALSSSLNSIVSNQGSNLILKIEYSKANQNEIENQIKFEVCAARRKDIEKAISRHKTELIHFSENLIKQMNGQINEPANSLIFYSFQLPLASIYQRRDNFNFIEKAKVLLIEDNKTASTLLEKYLTYYGFCCRCCSSEKEAHHELKRAKRKGEPYKVALIASEISGISSMNFGRAIKAQYGADISLIMLMRISESIDSGLLQESGFSDYIHKPLKLNRVLESLNKCCSSKSKELIRVIP